MHEDDISKQKNGREDYSSGELMITLSDVWDFGASGMVVGLVDGAPPNGHQVLRHSVAGQCRQRRICVDEQPTEVAVGIACVRFGELENEICGAECRPLRELRFEVELVGGESRARHDDAHAEDYRHDYTNSWRRHFTLASNSWNRSS